MSDPTRLRYAEGNDPARLLIESTGDDAPPAGARERALVALGGAGAASLTLTKAGAASGGAASGASVTALSPLAKGLIIISVAVTGTGAFVIATNGSEARQPAGSPNRQIATVEPPPTVPPPAAPTVQAPPRSVPPETSNPSAPEVTEQRQVLETARISLNAGRASVALKALNQYQQRYGFGLLGHEEAALRIEALLALGHRDEAARLARNYLATYPAGTQAKRIGSLLDRAAPQPAIPSASPSGATFSPGN